MARFKRLTWDDLDKIPRNELLPRLEAEQQYWARKAQSGMTEADQEARKEFSDILIAAINPGKLVQGLEETASRLKGERSRPSEYWTETPGSHELSGDRRRLREGSAISARPDTGRHLSSGP